MRYQLGIQILLIIVAVAIVFSVIKPKFADIQDDQNNVVAYRAALDNIGKYNQRLQILTNQSNAMPSSDRVALFNYLPEEIDVTEVSRDISNIVERNRLLLLEISFEPAKPVTAMAPDPMADSYIDPMEDMFAGSTELGEAETGLYAQQFKLEVIGTYDQMKSMLQDFERNNYPLRLVSFAFSLEEPSATLVQYSLTLETYALPGV